MATRLSTWAAAAYLATVGPSLAFAQQAEQSTRQQQPSWDWPCPWHMWNAGWGFWWIFPLLMLLMIVFCAGIFFLGHSRAAATRIIRRMRPLPGFASYVCPMHREVRESAAGKCPKCGMDLLREGTRIGCSLTAA